MSWINKSQRNNHLSADYYDASTSTIPESVQNDV
jgi:hypothetical protein